EQVQQERRGYTEAKLLNHLVSATQQRKGNGDAERFRSLEVDIKLDLGRLQHWKVGGLLAFENTAAIAARQPVSFGNIPSVARQTSRHSELSPLKDRRHRVTECQ